jgi:bifunctional non-homologous end joining protein LigD
MLPIFRPTLAQVAEQPFDRPDWQFEVKGDGIQALAYVETGQLRLFSRNNRDLTDHFPELHRLPRSLKRDRAVLDGEIVALIQDGKPSFLRLQKRIHLADSIQVHQAQALALLVFILFDILWWQSEDVTILPLAVRGELLQEGLRWEAPFVRSPVTQGTGGQLYHAVLEQTLEGIVAKRSQSRYIEGRSREWLKIKRIREIDCIVCGCTFDVERSRLRALILGLYQGNHLVHIGQVGSGLSSVELVDLRIRLEGLERLYSPFALSPSIPGIVRWVSPALVCRIQYRGWTIDKKLRQPVFRELRYGKAAQECSTDAILL